MLALRHWGRDKMAAISQTKLSNAFSWMKMLEFRLKFHWSLFLGVQLINNIPALVQIMAWRRSGDKPSSEPMAVSLLTQICVTRTQWVIHPTNYDYAQGWRPESNVGCTDVGTTVPTLGQRGTNLHYRALWLGLLGYWLIFTYILQILSISFRVTSLAPDNHTIAPVLVNQPWRIRITMSHGPTSSCNTTTK